MLHSAKITVVSSPDVQGQGELKGRDAKRSDLLVHPDFSTRHRDWTSGELTAVIFDMDGVLFDTEVLARHLWQEIFSEYGYTLPDETYKKVIGRTMEAARHILVEEYGPDLPMDAMFDEQDVRYRAALAQHVPQKPCVNEILDYLQLINMPCALGSSTHYADVITHLQVNGLRDYFTAVVGGDCVAQGKPAPDIFLECAKQLAVAPAHCLVIEDSNNGLRAANAAGMQAIMVPDLLAPKDTDSDLNFTVCASLCEVMDLLAAHAAHD